MTAEKVRPSLELTPAERQILHLFDDGPHDIRLVKNEATQKITGVVTDTGVVVDLEAMRGMHKKGWFFKRSQPDRYVLNSKGRRISETRL